MVFQSLIQNKTFVAYFTAYTHITCPTLTKSIKFIFH